ncbi:ATP12 family protein [Gluconobacter morbifer]|uniref:ATP12 chaperone protein n=1 Tax=Gluconobacter morbifer G707 TaxID=1088869 RepID=G6XFU4_9PROT|nr:ATP12 family chaperone protein [Gluconobacter morbifer]EHH69052.1 hypothetical protein GMO_03590 [Gluconobacter morbifer G707]
MHKRFWKTVSVEEADGRFQPVLDGRPIRLPQGHVLSVPTRALAQGIAAEWGRIAEGASFTPDSLPLTRIAGTMVERISPDPAAARQALLELGVDDGLCYRTASSPVTDRVFDWLKGKEIFPNVTDGLMPVAQSGFYMAGLRQLLARQDDVGLAALGVLAPALGSLLLALALVAGVVSEGDAVSLANADEEKQLTVWGRDDELIRTMTNRVTDVREGLQFLAFGQQK